MLTYMDLKFLKKSNSGLWSLGLWHCVFWYIITKILENVAASFFRIHTHVGEIELMTVKLLVIMFRSSISTKNCFLWGSNTLQSHSHEYRQPTLSAVSVFVTIRDLSEPKHWPLMNKCFIKHTNYESHQLLRVEQFEDTSTTHLVKASSEGFEMFLNWFIQYQVHIEIHKFLPEAKIWISYVCILLQLL